jgi:hypothetical protein
MRGILIGLSLLAGCASSGSLGKMQTQAPDLLPGERARLVEVDENGGFSVSWATGNAKFEMPARGCGTGEVVRQISDSLGRTTGLAVQQKLEVCPRQEHAAYQVSIDQRSMRGARVNLPVRDGFDFTAEVLPDGCISVSRLGATWSIEVPNTAAGDALRAHPELIGAAAAMGLLPLYRTNNISLALTN